MRKEKGIISYICFWIGLAAVGFMLLPFLVLGEDAVVVYHDQLDGELLAYMFHAQFPGAKVLEPFMGGMSVTALTAPAPLCTLLFASGHYFPAYVSMQLLGSLTGYLGIWLLGREMKAQPFFGMAAGVLFAYLPFLPVYGLSQYGVPLLIWSFLQLYQGRYKAIATIYALIYAACSSLVLVGFAVLGISMLVLGGDILRRKAGKQKVLSQGMIRTGSVWLGMLAVYVVENAGLLGQMLGLSSEAGTSHKAEYVLAAEPFLNGFLQNLWQGGQHSDALQKYILVAALLTLLVLVVRLCRKKIGTETGGGMIGLPGLLSVLLGGNVVLALIAAWWNSSMGVALRENMSALRGFQLDRVLWVAPAFWYLILLVVLEIWWGQLRECGSLWKKAAQKEGTEDIAGISAWKRWLLTGLCGIGSMAILFCTLLTAMVVLKGSCVKPNVQKLLNPSYSAISYRDYYAPDVMEQVKEYLTAQTGQEPEAYRVVSLGIDPAAAYYAGFYCLDGYSNNYSLEYKHAFRKVIAPELAKSEYLTQYYDGWGNRCYLVSAECPGYYTIEKGGFYFRQLELNTKALAELGGNYLLSAAYIQNAEMQGLTLMREEPFETQDSYYRIFLYEVTP